ncbi:MAG: sigma-54-dependent Fis family transcriptional regulator [Candidatus Eisenbacteria bacterium]|nr:sigma-54-dependent Fis family transcriptional regulator [Candidatus Eisenbacteria bacterium]
MSESQAFRILVVDDERELVRDLVDLLEDEGYVAEGAHSGSDAQAKLEETKYDLVLSDVRMPPPDGLALLRWIRSRDAELPVILLTAHADPELAREAIEAGAYDYVTKPWNTFELLLRVRRVREKWGLATQKARLERMVDHLTADQGRDGFQDLVATSAPMQEVLDLAARVAASDATVLIRGESGTGKSVLARAIHGLSARNAGSFVKVNCGAIPETLLESELFGHEKGAFTGAIRQKLGLFEIADGGTLFLDEIGDVSSHVQVKLLEVIEERAFHRVGGTERHVCDVRLLAATHRNLEEAIAEGDFREDLFYRLNVFPLVLPSLRVRRDDIPALVEHFLKKKGVDVTKMEAQAMQRFQAYDFPGNIREMENLLERALILAGNGPLRAEHFPTLNEVEVPSTEAVGELPAGSLSVDEHEKRLILAALAKAGGNKSQAAQLLGMTRRTLYSRMERHGISN